MPTSKRPRPKAKATRAAAPPIPTRRVREAYAAETDHAVQAAALEQASAIIERAVESGMPRVIQAAAHRALSLTPLCAEAYGLLSEEAGSDEVALDLCRRGVHAGGLAVGAHELTSYEVPFSDTTVGAGLMQALFRLADQLLAMDQEEEAVQCMQQLLVLDPADPLGTRYAMLAYALDQHELEPAQALIAAFPDDKSVPWLYGRMLLAYREERQAAPETNGLLAAAFAANAHVPAILAEEQAGVDPEEDDAPAEGSAEEATVYVDTYGEAWDSTPGAIEWLRSARSKFP